jgi:hypothetical protein
MPPEHPTDLPVRPTQKKQCPCWSGGSDRDPMKPWLCAECQHHLNAHGANECWEDVPDVIT